MVSSGKKTHTHTKISAFFYNHRADVPLERERELCQAESFNFYLTKDVLLPAWTFIFELQNWPFFSKISISISINDYKL